MNVYQWFKGQGALNPGESPALQFVNRGEDSWRYLKHHPIAFLADGKRLTYNAEHHGDVETGYVLEYLWVKPSKADFLKMIYAARVQAKVGLDEFDLTESRLNALTDFASRIGTPTLRLSWSELKKLLESARYYESQNQDDLALKAYRQIIDETKGSRAADEASRAIERLSDPAQKKARAEKREADIGPGRKRKGQSGSVT